MFKLIDVTKELPKHQQEVIVATNENLHMWYDEHYNEFRDSEIFKPSVKTRFGKPDGPKRPKPRCLGCGKEYELDETIYLSFGRGCGKSLLRLRKVIEHNCCSQECATRVVEALYNSMKDDDGELK